MTAMSSLSSNKKQKLGFTWRRLVDKKQSLPKVILSESPPVSVLSTILDMNRDHPAVTEKFSALESYLREVRKSHGVLKVSYHQHELSDHAPAEYRGSVKIGRSYPAGNATYLPRLVIDTLFKDSHVEVDMVSSYASVLSGVFQDYNIPTISAYALDAKPVFKRFRDEFGVNKDIIKKMFSMIVCSFPQLDGDIGITGDRLLDVMRSDFYTGVCKDLRVISAGLKDRYPGFLRMIENKVRAENNPGKEKRVIGIALAYLCGDVENTIMRSAMEFVHEKHPEAKNNMVWKYDGILVMKEYAYDLKHYLEAMVEDRLELKIRFAVKPLGEGIRLSVPPEELREMDHYERWKFNFEKRFFLLQTPCTYCWINEDETIQEINESAFKLLTMTEDKEMINKWKQDPGKRVYSKKDFCPPPIVLLPGRYNLYSGMAASHLTEDTTDVDLSMYKEHVLQLSGNVEEYANYIHKLLAYKIQKPGEVWRVMIFIRSTQGVGKDTWFEFLQKILGMSHTLRVTQAGDVCNNFSHLLEGRLLVGFSEMCAKDFRDNVEELKKMITSNDILVKRKYAVEYTIRSSACFIGFSNNYNAIKMGVDDRRFFAVTASGANANNAEYHVPLIEYFNRKDVQKAVFEYYLNMDISTFDPSGDRPVTDTMKEIREDSHNAMDHLFKENFERWDQMALQGLDSKFTLREGATYLKIDRNRFIDEFTMLAITFKYENTDSQRKMSQLALRLVRQLGSRMEAMVGIGVKTIQDLKSHGLRSIWVHREAAKKYIELLEDA